jgi:hypothetical protein
MSTVKPHPGQPGPPKAASTGTVVLKAVTVTATDGVVTRIVAAPDPVHIRPGAELTWQSEHPFVVRFDGATPVAGAKELHSHHGAAAGKVRSDAARVEPYKYSVAMWHADEVLIADPDVVVDPDPGP